MVNAQEYLDKKYPLTARINIKKLDISYKNLTGSLNLTGFNNLTKLNCSDNQLTKLILVNCTKLREINCSNNFLDKLNLNQRGKDGVDSGYSSDDTENYRFCLQKIDISGNKFNNLKFLNC